tara:strand:- start:3133 stop:4956 length:1824 start_codon:yes stop_codon:yes gene_type:complete
MTSNSINQDYDDFNYNADFTPFKFIFNTNTDNQRYVGIGTNTPEQFLTVRSDIFTGNLYIKNNFNYSHVTSHNNLSLLQLDSNNTLITPNLVSSVNDENGVEWSIVNNNNIKVTLRNYADNVRLNYFSNYYIINSNLFTTNIFSYDTITIRYIYIVKSNNEQINNTDINTINNANITIETVNFTSSLEQSTTNLFKLSSYITLHGNRSHIIKIENLTNNFNYYKIQFLGVYDYYSGSLWNNENNTTYTMKNVGIGISNPQAKLHIIGNGYLDGNIDTGSAFTATNIKTNKTFFKGNMSISNIYPNINSNLLIINPNKTPLGIGSVYDNDVFRINKKFSIRKNSTILANNIYVSNNLNIIGNTNFKNNNFTFSIKENSVSYQYNDNLLINNTPSAINISKLHIIDPNKTYSNNDTFFVDGNMTITGNLSLSNFKNITYNPKYDFNINLLKSSNIVVNTILHNEGFTYSDNADVQEIEFRKDYFIPQSTPHIMNIIHNSNINANTNTNASLYFDNSQNKFMFFDSEKSNELATNVKTINKYELYKLFTDNTSHITTIHSDYIEASTLDTRKNIIFDNQSTLYFNLNSMREEVLIYNNNNNTSYIFDTTY